MKTSVTSKKAQATARQESATEMTRSAPLSQTVFPIIVTSSNCPMTSEIQTTSETGCRRENQVVPASTRQAHIGVSIWTRRRDR